MEHMTAEQIAEKIKNMTIEEKHNHCSQVHDARRMASFYQLMDSLRNLGRIGNNVQFASAYIEEMEVFKLVRYVHIHNQLRAKRLLEILKISGHYGLSDQIEYMLKPKQMEPY